MNGKNISITKDKKSSEVWVVTKTDSEGFHHQMNLTHDELDELALQWNIVNDTPHLICPFCGGELHWDSDGNANEASDEYSEDDTAIVSYYTCATCGRDYEVFEPKKEDRESQYKDYWVLKER